MRGDGPKTQLNNDQHWACNARNIRENRGGKRGAQIERTDALWWGTTVWPEFYFPFIPSVATISVIASQCCQTKVAPILWVERSASVFPPSPVLYFSLQRTEGFTHASSRSRGTATLRYVEPVRRADLSPDLCQQRWERIITKVFTYFLLLYIRMNTLHLHYLWKINPFIYQRIHNMHIIKTLLYTVF